MGIFDELKRMAHPFEDEDDDFEEYETAAPRATERRERGIDRYERPERVERVSRNNNNDNYDVIGMENERRSNKVVNIRAATQLQVVLVKPEKFDDASAIADHLREKRTVVLNLESTNKEIARRLLDFLSGVAYANEGKIKKVAISTYIITPYNVDILGDLIDELENNGLYF
jgi:cell division inhibitor SepF